MNEPNITYTPFVFPDQTIPKGKLIADMRCQAAWYYYVLAHKAFSVESEGEFGLLEGSPWLDPQYEQLAYSVSQLYDCPIEEFMKFMPIVALECERLGMTTPNPKYLKPRRFI